jgi:CTP synthase
MKAWRDLNDRIKGTRKDGTELRVAVVGKYFETGDYQLSDVYLSVVEALKHASWASHAQTKLTWISSSDIEKKGAEKVLAGFDAIVVPGGFGSRGTEGLVETVRFAREQKVPYLGLCYGMQLATIEFARNVAKLDKAHTTEVDAETPHPVIHIMSEQEKKVLAKDYGASMRLGGWECRVAPGSLAEKLYKEGGRLTKEGTITERHRHRYELNNEYREKLEKAGLVISGTSPDGTLAEIIELPGHPYFIATQFHPEFTSRPFSPSPVFLGLVQAALALKK